MSLNRTKIDWADYVWNPVVGCKNGCWYCYAKRMNDRFKWIKKWDKPVFFPDRLIQPALVKHKPGKIFVGSMCDLFGEWVPKEWIWQILDVVRQCPQHTFQFLTKNPKRYSEFEFPDNCWLGVTITGENFEQDRLRLNYLSKLKRGYKFYSIEPLLGKIPEPWLEFVNLVIVGAMTGPGAIKPKKEWIDSIKHPNIFYKDNIKPFL